MGVNLRAGIGREPVGCRASSFSPRRARRGAILCALRCAEKADRSIDLRWMRSRPRVNVNPGKPTAKTPYVESEPLEEANGFKERTHPRCNGTLPRRPW